MLLYICYTFNPLHVSNRFCIFQRIIMQNIIILLNVMSNNISKNYKQDPVHISILRNGNIILLNQVHIKRYRYSQPIIKKPHQPYTFVVLKHHHQSVQSGLAEVNSISFKQIFFRGKWMSKLLITNLAVTKPKVLHYHWYYYHLYLQLCYHPTGSASRETLWM